jgi:hypothetical protein
MHWVGLPVDSVAVAGTRTVEARLKEALREHDGAGVAQNAQLLRARLSHLASDEKGRVENEATTLLQQANQFGDQGGVDRQGPAGSGLSGDGGGATGREGSGGPNTGAGGGGDGADWAERFRR